MTFSENLDNTYTSALVHLRKATERFRLAEAQKELVIENYDSDDESTDIAFNAAVRELAQAETDMHFWQNTISVLDTMRLAVESRDV